MDSEPLPSRYLKAGEEYLAALRSLGLYPEFLGWAYQERFQQWILVMVASIIEVGGPLAFNELLFRAYNMGATPKEISPFIVRVYGSRSLMAPHLRIVNQFRTGELTVHRKDIATGKSYDLKEQPNTFHELGEKGLTVWRNDSYPIKPRKQSQTDRTNAWINFKRNVQRLSA